MKFNFITAASVFSDSEEQVNKIIGRYADFLERSGGKRISRKELNNPEPLFYFAVTGGVENLVLDILKERSQLYEGEPVFLIAHPANNSLPASLEILAKLKQDNIRGEIFYYSSPGDNDTLKKITSAADDLNVLNYLRQTRIGVIGNPSDWLVASTPEYQNVRKKWGPELVTVPIEEILDTYDYINEDEFRSCSEQLINRAAGVFEPSSRDIEDAAKIYASIKKIILKYRLNSVTVRCFDFVLKSKTTGCLALSCLTDEGFIAGCEGDIMSIIAMVWGNRLLGITPWMANPSRIDEKNNLIWLAHCTVPRRITTGYNLRSHFESGLGVGIQGFIPEGPVTLVRLGGKEIEKIWLAEGYILKNGNADNLCRTQVEIQIEKGGNASDLLKSPLGNHLVMFTGRHMNRLAEWHRTYSDGT